MLKDIFCVDISGDTIAEVETRLRDSENEKSPDSAKPKTVKKYNGGSKKIDVVHLWTLSLGQPKTGMRTETGIGAEEGCKNSGKKAAS